MKLYSCLFLLLLTCFLFPVPASALTHITANISTSTVWKSSGSPYLIDSPIAVLPQATLTIMPGVVVKSLHAPIEILGGLTAEGTPSQKIYFTSLYDDSLAGDSNADKKETTPSAVDPWGLVIHGQSTSTLSNVSIQYAGQGLQIFNTQAVLENLSYGTSSRGISLFNSATVNCNQCHIQNITASSYDSVLSLYNSSTLSLIDSSITQSTGQSFLSVYDTSGLGTSSVYANNLNLDTGNGSGITIFGNAELEATNTTIRNFAFDGIQGYGQALIQIASSTIIHNQNGLDIFQNLTGLLASSTVTDNADYGILSRTDKFFNAAGNWWGTSTGPYNLSANPQGTGNQVSDNVTFDPWITENAPKTPICCSSVLFIPGFEGSRLYTKGALFENQLWEPNRNQDVVKLDLNPQGTSINNIYTRDIITTTNYPAFNQDIYQKLHDTLDGLKQSKVIADWQAFPYDWRYDVRDVVEKGTTGPDNQTIFIIDELKKLAATSKTGKVIILTHSNGGLLAKALVDALGKINKDSLVDKIIMVAPPQAGTPEAVADLLHGDTLGPLGILMDRQTSRQLGLNMPSAYTLLPSEKYLSSGSPVVSFDASIDSISNMRKIYGSTISSYREMVNFIEGNSDHRAIPLQRDTDAPAVLNSSLIDKAKTYHDTFDDFVFPASIPIHQIIGTGISTVQGLNYVAKGNCLLILCTQTLDHQPIFTYDGDGTVVAKSVETTPATNYYFNLSLYNGNYNENRMHSDMLEANPLLEAIGHIIKGDQNPANPAGGLTTTDVYNIADHIDLSVHSPVTLNLYDSNGRHTGLIPLDGTLQFIEQQIPNSYYRYFGEGQYAGVSATSTSVHISGEGIGTFSLDIAKTIQGHTSTTTFQDVPVLPTTEATISIDQTHADPELHVDLDGDGQEDLLLKKDQDFNPVDYLNSLKEMIRTFSIKDTLKDTLFKKIDRCLDLIHKGKIAKIQQKIRSSIKAIEKKTQHAKNKKLSSDEQQVLISMLNQLLDSLNEK